jgi:methylenetetrahydrofolate dehydrogenase (NADP+)/methenyltetrahydrofolate cyclohydrolase
VDGRAIAREIEQTVKTAVQKTKSSPGLATVQVGENYASQVYARLIHKASKRVGIGHTHDTLGSESDLLSRIQSLNADKTIHGILIHRPLPSFIDERTIISSIAFEKDVDGVHPAHLGQLALGVEEIIPCAPQAAVTVLERYSVEIQGKNAVVVGHSSGVGKPMTLLLLNRNATVTSCHVYTENLQQYTKKADILVTAAGMKGLVTTAGVKEGVVILDIGGDVEEDVASKASLFTPTPGGIGPITVALLMDHTFRMAQR